MNASSRRTNKHWLFDYQREWQRAIVGGRPTDDEGSHRWRPFDGLTNCSNRRDAPKHISFITKDHENPSDDLIAAGAEGASSL